MKYSYLGTIGSCSATSPGPAQSLAYRRSRKFLEWTNKVGSIISLLFYKWRKWGAGKLSGYSNVTQPVNGRAGTVIDPSHSKTCILSNYFILCPFSINLFPPIGPSTAPRPPLENPSWAIHPKQCPCSLYDTKRICIMNAIIPVTSLILRSSWINIPVWTLGFRSSHLNR